MGTGVQMRDQYGMGAYVREKILPFAPREEPLPFRGRLDGSSEPLPFFEEMETSLREKNGAVWNVTGPSGSGKTYFARWASAHWGRRFLDEPDRSPAVLWLDAGKLRAAFQDDRCITGGPFVFALAAEVAGVNPEALARGLTRHPCIIVIDKDEDPALASWQPKLPVGLPPGLRFLHLALKDSLGGPSVRLELWDRETALLIVHHRRGAEGVRLLEAVAASPFAGLLSYPPYVAWLLSELGREGGINVEKVSSGACLFDFLREMHWAHPGPERELQGWCKALLGVLPESVIGKGADSLRAASSLARLQVAARKLHLDASPGADPELGRIFRAFLLAEPLRSGNVEDLLESRLLAAEDLRLLSQVPWPSDVKEALGQAACMLPPRHPNMINLHWWILRKPLPKKTELTGLTGLQLPGHPFPGSLVDVRLEDSNLSGISLGTPNLNRCEFLRCSLREANLAGAKLSHSKFIGTRLELADFSECEFQSCTLELTSLVEAVLGGAAFTDSSFHKVAFGTVDGNEPIRFVGCSLRGCDVARLALSGFSLRRCKLTDVTFANLAPRSLDAEESELERCDLMGLAARHAHLRRVKLKECILADSSLRGADLREAAFTGVEFQPGPASRAGMTDEMTRSDPLHGSKSGFYAQDMADGVYLDPELTRTADLREADLRGAVFKHTDLFRVDLRGAKMDRSLLEMARRMRAFVD